MPDEELTDRISLQWQKIGFQGKDPATDFRGMGILGLEDLVYYTKYHTDSAREVLACSQDPIRWYSFAIVGINITSFAVEVLRNRQLQYHLHYYGATREAYHEFYCKSQTATHTLLLIHPVRLCIPSFQSILDDTYTGAYNYGF
jgi:hypothetical protein